jgi:hypothetical protein
MSEQSKMKTAGIHQINPDAYCKLHQSTPSSIEQHSYLSSEVQCNQQRNEQLEL